jgi:NAD(P)-dependent dehydrogenase (short-subunit alcohol dehydrogenase family)
MAGRNGAARFAGKVVLVTGASSGIGKATALAFGREGAAVVVAARREAEGEETARAIRAGGGEARFVRADVTREVEVAALVGRVLADFGQLDVAFNNAGLGAGIAPVAELSEAAWHEQIAGNLTSVFLSMKHEAPAMLRNGGGAIVNTASVLGLVGIGGIAAYVAAKHGVVGLTRAAALELAQAGIRVNAIAPAVVDTALFRASLGATEEGVRGATALHPVGRLGAPEEVASLVLYLASDEASFLTGAALPVDGGWSAQ